MSKQEWVTRRVMVEVPVRGDYSEKDLRWDVARLVDGGHLMRAARKFGNWVLHGRVEVKEYSRVVTAVKRRGKLRTVEERLDDVEAARYGPPMETDPSRLKGKFG